MKSLGASLNENNSFNVGFNLRNPKLDTLLNGMSSPPDSDDDDFERETEVDFIFETLSDNGLITIEESEQI